MNAVTDIELNGAPHRLTGEAHVQALVESLALTQQSLAISVNRQIVPRAQWAQRILRPLDRVEVVRAIGGG